MQVRSEATAMLAAQRKALARRPEAIRRVMARAGRLFETAVIRHHMSGRPGLNYGGRRTLASGKTKPITNYNGIVGHAKAAWVRIAVIRGDTITLVVGNRAAYLGFHTDTYKPKGTPRHNPIRLPSGRLWEEAMKSPLLAQQIATAGFSDA